MTKRTLILLTVVALISLSLASCSTYSNKSDEAAVEMANFKVIDGKDYMVYDLDTRVIYYMFSTRQSVGNAGYGYSYFAPYISENGNYCRYINDEIVEITDKDTNN